ncbi:MAG: FAD-binding protein, partial [Actinomycetota bacterium]
MSDQTTYRVGGRAAFHLVAESLADLEAVAELMDRTHLPVVVLGRGSNVLFADTGYPGLVLQLGEFASVVEIPAVLPETGLVEVRIGASVALPVAARLTAAAGLRGFEWAVGVPGSLGGAVRMNAGGHGSDMAHSLRSADVFDLRSGVLRSMTPSELNLGFRRSALDDAAIVLSVDLELHRGSSAEGMALID